MCSTGAQYLCKYARITFHTYGMRKECVNIVFLPISNPSGIYKKQLDDYLKTRYEGINIKIRLADSDY